MPELRVLTIRLSHAKSQTFPSARRHLALFIARALASYKDSVGVLVDTWGYLSADYADLVDYADLERMELDFLNGE